MLTITYEALWWGFMTMKTYDDNFEIWIYDEEQCWRWSKLMMYDDIWEGLWQLRNNMMYDVDLCNWLNMMNDMVMYADGVLWGVWCWCMMRLYEHDI